jgi:uncharacterized protein
LAAPGSSESPKFICDVHLGKLARLLRLLGFDTIYRNNLEDDEIIRIARTDERIALTRDQEILADETIRCYRPESIFPDEQILEMVSKLDLHRHCQPFTRCLDCNGEIMPVDKETVIEQVPLHSGQVMEKFWQCQGCGKIYWHGSHYEKMKTMVEGLPKP